MFGVCVCVRGVRVSACSPPRSQITNERKLQPRRGKKSFPMFLIFFPPSTLPRTKVSFFLSFHSDEALSDFKGFTAI